MSKPLGYDESKVLKHLMRNGLICRQPAKNIMIKSKYPSTMSDSLMEHLIVILRRNTL